MSDRRRGFDSLSGEPEWRLARAVKNAETERVDLVSREGGKLRVQWWALWLLVAAAPLGALSPEKSVDQFARTWWTRVDGLPQSAVQAVARSDPGYLWIGTQDGLARFEGDSFAVFRRENTRALESDFITSLSDAGGGRLWIGTRRGLVLFDGGSFERYDVEQGLRDAYVRALTIDAAGQLWVGTSGDGLYRYRDGRFEGVAIESRVVRALLASEGGIWVGGSAGLERVDSEGRRRDFEHSERFSGRSIRALAANDQGLWVGIDDGALALWSEADVLEENPGLDGISALIVDAEATLWAAGPRGVKRRVASGQRWQSVTQVERRTAPAYTLYEDRAGSMWIGSRHGLLRLGDGRVTVFGIRQGLVDSLVRVVKEDPAGRLWVGSSSGLSWREAGETAFHEVPEFAGVAVRAVWSDGATILIGTQSGAFELVMREAAGKKSFVSAPIGPRDVSVDVVLRDPEGHTWIGTQGRGLFLSPAEAGAAFVPLLQSLERPYLVVRTLQWTEAQKAPLLWIGTEGGLLYWNGTRIEEFDLQPPGESTASSPAVLSLHVDLTDPEVLWLGTANHGLARIHGEEQVWFTQQQGLFDNLVFRVLEDRVGNLWMTSGRGVSLVAKDALLAVASGSSRQLQSRWFDESDGFLNAECNGGTQPAGWIDSEQQVWVPTVDGLARIDAAEMDTSLSESGAVWIEEVLLNRQPLRSRAGTYSIPPGRRDLEVRYASASHLSSSQSRFAYRLVGFDDRWQDVGSRRAAFFTNLSPGEYRFEVRSVSRFGTVHEAPAIVFSAPPRLTERRAFWWLLALGAVVLVLGAAWLRLRTLRQQRERLAGLVEQRTAELAAAMHDLERLATQDALTGVANPRRLLDRLQSEWSRAQRTGQELACLMVDVDYFKQVNDQLGHAAGDLVLQCIAQALSAHVRRAGELVARRGGDEFVVLLPSTGVAAAKERAEAMRAEVDRRVAELVERETWPAGLAPSISVGVAALEPVHDAPASTLLDRADEAVYRAKWEGRNRVAV